MKKIIILLLSSILVLFGCSSNGNSGDDKLTIWSFYEGVPKLAADYYAEQSGTEVEFVAFGWDDYITKLNTVLGTPEEPDIIILERSILGTYVNTGKVANMSEVFADSEKFTTYTENISPTAASPAIVDGSYMAIGWENTSNVMYYRSDMASQCLGINSPEQMMEEVQTPEDLLALQDEFRNSDDEYCQEIALFGNGDVISGYMPSDVKTAEIAEDGTATYTISKEYINAIETAKELVNNDMIYSPTWDSTQMINGALEDKWFCTVAPTWYSSTIKSYEQPGQWAVAKAPFPDFSSGGSYLAMTNSADSDLVLEMLEMTFLDDQWVIDNMDAFGMVANETVMTEYLAQNPDANADPYYSGQNVIALFAEVNAEATNTTTSSIYEQGIGTAIDEVKYEYAIEQSIPTIEEAIATLETKIHEFYPDMIVVVEE